MTLPEQIAPDKFDSLYYTAIAEHTKPPIQMIEFGTRWRDKRTVNENGTPICDVSK